MRTRPSFAFVVACSALVALSAFAVLVAATILLTIGVAHAQSYGPPQPVIDLDFTRSDTVPDGVTVSQSATTTGWDCSSPQKLVTFAPNTGATHLCDAQGHSLGIRVNGPILYQNAWSNDLTQPAVFGSTGWVATNATVTFSAGAGIDSNGGSTVTATAPNATICQPFPKTLPPQIKMLTAYVKRLSGTGSVWMTQDGAATSPHWNLISGLINTSGYTLVPRKGLIQSVPAASLCFKIDTSGDSVGITYVNLINTRHQEFFGPTTPFLMTAANFVNVPQDIVTIPLTGVNPDSFTVVMKMNVPNWYSQIPIGNSNYFMEVSDGTGQNELVAYMQHSALNDRTNDDYAASIFYAGLSQGPKTRCALQGQSADTLPYLTPPFAAEFSVVAIGYSTATGLGIACNNAGGSGNTQEVLSTPSGTTHIPAGTLRELVIGGTRTLGNGMFGYVQRAQVYNGRLQGGALTAIQARLDPAVPARRPTYVLLTGGSGKLLLTGAVQPTTGAMQCNQC